jgi:hypothetical protein
MKTAPAPPFRAPPRIPERGKALHHNSSIRLPQREYRSPYGQSTAAVRGWDAIPSGGLGEVGLAYIQTGMLLRELVAR